MARVPLLGFEDLPPADRELVWRRGNLYKALANSPELAARFAAFGFWVNTASQIESRMQELVILHIAFLLQSRFEWAAHVKVSIEREILSAADIAAVRTVSGDGQDALSDLERNALKIARSVIRHRKADDDAYAAMRAVHSDSYMTEFAGLVGMYVGLAHLIEILDIDVPPENLHWLESFPIEAR